MDKNNLGIMQDKKKMCFNYILIEYYTFKVCEGINT